MADGKSDRSSGTYLIYQTKARNHTISYPLVPSYVNYFRILLIQPNNILFTTNKDRHVIVVVTKISYVASNNSGLSFQSYNKNNGINYSQLQSLLQALESKADVVEEKKYSEKASTEKFK